jgi:hypothetical protein
MPGGRQSLLNRVLETWGEPEEVAEYPAATVFSIGAGAYDPSKLSPHPDPALRIGPPDGRYLLATSEFSIQLTVELWTTDPKERSALVAALEDALSPVEWMYGLRLALPHYFGAHATYEPLSSTYMDDAGRSMQRYRLAMFVVQANIAVMRLKSLPSTVAKARVEVVE